MLQNGRGQQWRIHANMDTMLNHESPDYLRTRLQVVIVEHRDLDEVIGTMSVLPEKNELLLQRLKKRKLALRDQIAQLERLLEPDVPA